MIRILAAIAVAAVALAAPAPAEACSWFQNQPFTIDTEPGTDTVAPTMTTSGWEIYRSEPDSTCAGVVNLDLRVAATDDASGVGYEVTVVSANVDFNGLGDAIVSPSLSGGLSYQTGYGPTATPLLDLQLTIRAVDRAGNYSAPVEVHVLEEDTDEGGGCSAGGRGAAGSALLLALAALLARRPRQARRVRMMRG